VNVPYDVPLEQAAIFWFGRVSPTDNYSDVRVIYDETGILLRITTFDRRLWYNPDAAGNDLTSWDAATVYLGPGSNTGEQPTGTYRFDAQLVWWERRDASFQTAYRGNGGTWEQAAIDFKTASNWRGDEPNNHGDDRGWWLQYRIPFESLGLDGPPRQGTVWRFAVAVHDRDDLNTPIGDTLWPANMVDNQPETWGQLAFGLPTYSPLPVSVQGTTTIRHGLHGATVVDADVGGSSVCGAAAAPDFFATWGNLNYAGKGFFNVQNQEDVSDWPCFSKYYVTFPLNSIPAHATIVSATLILHLWGNAGEGWEPEPQPSLIQALTVSSDWNEATITWNNAPLARENVAATLVEPVSSYPGRPGIPYHWDVSRAVAQAHASGNPLRLAMYESDLAYHSGKYFDTCETDEWGAEGRPTLKVTWGLRLDTPYATYLPMALARESN